MTKIARKRNSLAVRTSTLDKRHSGK